MTVPVWEGRFFYIIESIFQANDIIDGQKIESDVAS